ncbi:hypothetical protein Tco_1190351 [Tanacetum coccineum]
MRPCAHARAAIHRKEGRYTEKDTSIIVWHMLKVAAKCHLHGLVHCDMKSKWVSEEEKGGDGHVHATCFVERKRDKRWNGGEREKDLRYPGF